MNFGTADADYIETLRYHLVYPIGKFLAAHNDHLYVERPTPDRQFVGIVDKGEEAFENDLTSIGASRNPVAAIKHLRSDNSVQETGSWYFVDDDNKVFYDLPEAAQSWDSDKRNDFQLHIILFEIDGDSGTTAVFAHHELWWGTHPWAHYRAKYYNEEYGVRKMRELLRNEYGESYSDLVTTDVTVDEVLRNA